MKINWYDIVQTLKVGYPVFTASYNTVLPPKKQYGHTYLIDKAEYIMTTLYNVYDLRSSDNNPNIEDTEDQEEQDECPEYETHSLDFYRTKYGAIEYYYNSELAERWLMMNWGGTKSLNSVKINADEKIIKISTFEFDDNLIYKIN